MTEKSIADRNLVYAKYPTPGEMLRFFVNALGLRERADKRMRDRLDRAAREGEFAPGLIEELVGGLIVQPMDDLGCYDAGCWLADYAPTWVYDELRLVARVSADGLTREELLRILVENLYAGRMAGFMEMAHAKGLLPEPELLLADCLPIANICESTFGRVCRLHFPGRSSTDIAKVFYGGEASTEHPNRDKFVRWVDGKQLPDLAGLILLLAPQKDSHDFCPIARGARQKMFIKLMLARAVDYVFSKVPEDIGFRAKVRNMSPLSAVPIVDIGKVISEAVINRATQRWEDVIKAGLSACHSLSFDSKLRPDQIEDAATKLAAFEKETKSVNAPWATDWMLVWCRARLALWKDDWVNAVDLYDRAYRCALYNAGRESGHVWREAMYVACALHKRPMMKRLLWVARTQKVVSSILLGDDDDDVLNSPNAMASLLRMGYMREAPELVG